jgi:hypothetical protein
MKYILFLLAFSVLAFADKPSGVWRFARTNSMQSTAWNHPGTIIDLGDKVVSRVFRKNSLFQHQI